MIFRTSTVLCFLFAYIGSAATKETIPLWSMLEDTNSKLTYYLVSYESPVTWHEAAEYCRTNFTSGQLALLLTPPIIGGVQRSLGGHLPDSQHAWVGGRRDLSGHEFDFFWMNSTKRIPIGGMIIL